MAKEITLIHSDSKDILYPKTVSELVYDNETGATVKQLIGTLNNKIQTLQTADETLQSNIDSSESTLRNLIKSNSFTLNSNIDLINKHLKNDIDENKVDTDFEIDNLKSVLGTVETADSSDYTVTKTLKIATSQGFTVPYNFKKGNKYRIRISTTVDNTDYYKIQRPYTSENINESLLEHPLDKIYYCDSSTCYLVIIIRGVEEEGECTISINRLTEEFQPNKYVPIKAGKNLFDPTKAVNSVFTKTAEGQYVINPTGTTFFRSDWIPIRVGETLHINKIPDSKSKYIGLFKNYGDMVAIDGSVVDSTNTQSITNNLDYNAYAVFFINKNVDLNTVQIESGTESTPYEPYNPIEGYLPKPTDYSSYGYIGENFPSEIDDILILDQDKNDFYKSLRFIHCSDSHGESFGYADEFVDKVNADFLVHTGNLVAESFEDSYESSLNRLLAINKPSYIVLGVWDSVSSNDVTERFNKYFTPELLTKNNLSINKTYYKVDYTEENVKCIFLDISDGVSASTVNPNNWTYYAKGDMSLEQVQFLIDELKDANSNHLAVCIFMNIKPCEGEQQYGWDDLHNGSNSSTTCSSIDFIKVIVNAFIKAQSFSITYKEQTFSDSFSYKGSFAGYFCGHSRLDLNGWDSDYPEQHYLTVPMPYRSTSNSHDGTYREKIGEVFNYVRINYDDRIVTVYRVGQQKTWNGVDRKSYYYKF